MIKQTIFNFDVRKDARAITVERSFNAPRNSVWAAWTQADILCKWWAPKPYECVIASLDFREGGRWLYYMQGPGGDRHWCYFDYETIRPMSHFSGSDAFCDEHGVANNIKPKVSWEANFSDADGSTLVSIVLHFGSAEDLERIIQMGFKEGFTQGLQQLEELLASV